MKKGIALLIAGISAVFSFLFGFLVRQPKINKTKKQIELLQSDNSKLITMIDDSKDKYQELLIQHKALKAMQRRKRIVLNEKISENLIMQYAIREYLILLLKNGREHLELEKDEVSFFNSFEKVINGEKLTKQDKTNVKKFIIEKYQTEIKELKECEYTETLESINKVIK
ncbi:MAG: hypothetical protein E7557_05890 [Ruminococcaceae bacterium]|nr:hypothetical protein [Oscillospiraceae bacterium]